MHTCDNHLSDAAIILLLVKKNKIAWVHIYGKYAAMMYGIVFNLAKDETTAAEILIEIFDEIKQKNMLSNAQSTLCHILAHFTRKLTIEHLTQRGLNLPVIQETSKEYPLVSTLFFGLSTVNDTGENLGIAKEEILVNLREEFNQLRSKGE